MLSGEVCIDLAFARREQGAAWLDHAAQLFDRVIDKPSPLARQQRIRHALVKAHLRRAELPNWFRISEGLQPINPYGLLLNANRDALPFAKPTDDTWSTLQEEMPLLLGARRNLWVGRTSLLRENASFGVRKLNRRNPNWDAGICLEDTPASFDQPTIKLQVKARPTKSESKHLRPSSYRRAGVVPIAASTVGFDNPAQIVASCLHELDLAVPFALGETPLLSGGELDAITDRLVAEIPKAAWGD